MWHQTDYTFLAVGGGTLLEQVLLFMLVGIVALSSGVCKTICVNLV